MNNTGNDLLPQFDLEKLGQHGWFFHTTEWGPACTPMNHIKFLPIIPKKKCATKRAISKVKKLNCLIKGKIRSHDLNMVTGQTRSLALPMHVTTFGLLTDQ